jgi:hypothetical protein
VRRLVVLLALVVGATATACQPDTVRLTYRPQVGDVQRYEVRVHSVTEVRIGTAPVERRQEDVVLTAEHTVVQAGSDGIRVQVVLSGDGEEPRRFQVVFDRSAQLREVESIEGLPEEALGTFGIAEIFPAAAGAPPDQLLAPGGRWVIDEEVLLPGAPAPTSLRGRGRLLELGVVDGEHVARIESRAQLPLSAVRPSSRGEVRLEGVQDGDYRATHDLDDGSVREASSSTVGRYDIDVVPPPGSGARRVPGTLVVRVESETRRLGTG